MPESFEQPSSPELELNPEEQAVAEALKAGDEAVLRAWDDDRSREIDAIATAQGGEAGLSAIIGRDLAKAKICFAAGRLDLAREAAQNVMDVGGNDPEGDARYGCALALMYRIVNHEPDDQASG